MRIITLGGKRRRSDKPVVCFSSAIVSWGELAELRPPLPSPFEGLAFRSFSWLGKRGEDHFAHPSDLLFAVGFADLSSRDSRERHKLPVSKPAKVQLGGLFRSCVHRT